MLFIILIVAFAALGVGLGILFNKLVIKDFPESGRKMSYIKTVVIFLLITVVLFALLYGNFLIGSTVRSKSIELEQDIKKNYSNLDFVKNGINMTAVNDDVSKLNNTVADLNKILKPIANKYNVPNLVYDMAIGSVTKELKKKLVVVNAAGKAANSFVDDKNFITVSSLINGVRAGILKVVNIIVIVLVVIFVILLGIYILVSLSKASKGKKRTENENAG
jgi:Tfp pilus assembly protein PilO